MVRKISQFIFESNFGDMGWREVIVLAELDTTTPDNKQIIDIKSVEFMPPGPSGINILPYLKETAKNTYAVLIMEQQNNKG